MELFKKFSIDETWNTVVWMDGELDIAPETLYYEATGSWPEQQVMQVAEEPPEYDT